MTPIERATNTAIQQAQQVLTSRLALVEQMGLDSKRPRAWDEYGYKPQLCFDDFYRLYQRGGVAHGAVERLVEKCWQTDPWVIQGDPTKNKTALTGIEDAWGKLFKELNVWPVFQEADRRRLVGRYSGIIFQIADGLTWDQPASGTAKIVKLIPVWANQLKALEEDENEASETFGQVTKWLYKERRVGKKSKRTVNIDASRIFILGDYRNESVAYLEPGYNDCVNLEKIIGGSGESFLKNAARQIVVEFTEGVGFADIAQGEGISVDDLKESFNQKARDLNSGIDVLFGVEGGTAKPLVANVPQPGEHFDIALQSFSASVRIASKILVGNQTGERASTEDQKDFNARGQGRRINRLSPEIQSFVGHLASFGIVPREGEKSVMWDNLTQASRTERLTDAKLMAETNTHGVSTGGAYFSDEEIREVAGYDGSVA